MIITRNFGNYSVDLSSCGVNIKKKNIIKLQKIIFSHEMKFHEDTLFDTVEGLLNDLMSLDGYEYDSDLKSCCDIIKGMFKGNRYLENFHATMFDHPLGAYDVYLLDKYFDIMLGVYANQAGFIGENETLKAKMWQKEGILNIFRKGKKDLNILTSKLPSNNNKSYTYFVALLKLEVPEITSYLFNHYLVDIPRSKWYKIFKDEINPLIYTLSMPNVFNHYHSYFGDEFYNERFKVEEDSNVKLNLFEYIISESKDLRYFNMSIFRDCQFDGTYTPYKKTREFYTQYIYSNIYYYSDKERCVKNLKIFFNFLNARGIQLNLNVLHNNKSLLEYAKDEFNYEMMEILLDNGANPKFEFNSNECKSTFKLSIENEIRFYKKTLNKINSMSEKKDS
jgi:hypothetical protein